MPPLAKLDAWHAREVNGLIQDIGASFGSEGAFFGLGWYIGGAGYIVRTDQATLLIDPFLGPSNPPSWLRAIRAWHDAGRLDQRHTRDGHGHELDVRAVEEEADKRGGGEPR